MLEKLGYIEDLRLQVPYLLQEGFVKDGKKHREITYIADFVYTENDKTIVEDSKGVITDVFAIKQKLFEKRYPELTISIV